MASIGLRIFRRNSKGIILLFNKAILPDKCKDSVCAFLVDVDGNEGPLTFTPFIPDAPEKFAAGVSGIVINHIQNKIDPSKPCTIKLIFGEDDESFEVVKSILPANSAPEMPEKNSQIVHIYGFDYKSKTWVPMPVNRELLGGE